MTVAIHQPNFIPWVGYFNKISKCDVFVLFDDVQFPRAKTYGNRVEIKTNNGASWLTVPVLERGELKNFNETEIDNTQGWCRKTAKTLKLAYQKGEGFKEYWEEFEHIYFANYSILTDLNIALMKFAVAKLGLATKLVLSSELAGSAGMMGAEKILHILKELNATEYLSGKGAGSRRYIDETDFEAANIRLTWQAYQPTPYRQLWGGEFVPNLSIVDLLFNEGRESANYL